MMSETKDPMTTVKGDGMLTLKGGITTQSFVITVFADGGTGSAQSNQFDRDAVRPMPLRLRSRVRSATLPESGGAGNAASAPAGASAVAERPHSPAQRRSPASSGERQRIHGGIGALIAMPPQ